MITTDWMDDAAATRLLKVVEEHKTDFSCAVEVLNDLTNTFFQTGLNNEGRAECIKQAHLNYDTITAQLHLIEKELLLFDRDIEAAVDGEIQRVQYEQQYLNEIAGNQ